MCVPSCKSLACVCPLRCLFVLPPTSPSRAVFLHQENDVESFQRYLEDHREDMAEDAAAAASGGAKPAKGTSPSASTAAVPSRAVLLSFLSDYMEA